ncbi:MAG: GYD domain-containing protein [Deltaproteobacteria bacterium]|nr:GYD domain-containing protein [Deltaproteobacteria bacterium]
MPTYITLWKYTREGMMDLRNTSSRFDAVKKIIETNGGKLVQLYGLVGEYDVITIIQMPNKSAMMATIMKICASGRITAKTMSALPAEEFLNLTREM